MRSLAAHLRCLLLAILALAGSTCVAASPDGYAFTILSYPGVDYSNGGFTAVSGINNQGEVTGSAYDGNETITPFVYSLKNGLYTPLSAEVPKTFADGINDRGVVVGGEILLDSNQIEFETAFILDKGAITRVSNAAPLLNTEFRAINSSGLIVGIASDDPNFFGNIISFLYDSRTGGWTYLFPSTGDNPAIIGGINARGDAVGNAYFDADVVCQGCPAANYGYVRDAKGAFTLFLVNGRGTRPRGISDSGLIAGYVRTDCEGESPFAGFVTSLARGPGFQSLTFLCDQLFNVPGALVTYPQGISNSGVVVGNWLDADYVNRGFVATPVNKK